MQALLPAARLHLARGDLELARAWPPAWPAGDGRRPAAGPELLAVVVDAELAAGDLAAAAAAATELARPRRPSTCRRCQPAGGAARARVLAAPGDAAGAAAALRGGGRRPRRRRALPGPGTLLLDLAACRERAGDLGGAALDARRPRRSSAGSTWSSPPADADLLDRLVRGDRDAAAAVRGAATLARDGSGGRPDATARASGCRTRRACATWPS